MECISVEEALPLRLPLLSSAVVSGACALSVYIRDPPERICKGVYSLSGGFTAEVSIVIVGARSLRRVDDWPGSSFERGSDIMGVSIQGAIHALAPGFVYGVIWIRRNKCPENDNNSLNS